MRAKTLITALLLAPPLCGYAEDTQPDGDLLEFIASLETVDGELLDPMEINNMFDPKTIQEKTIRESDNE